LRVHPANKVTASSLLPFPRNEFFIGREEQLQQLLDQSLFDPNHHKRMSLYGLGGCGKSAFALEFAYRALKRDASLLVFWVPAFSHESFELAYREIGSYLRVPGISNNNADIIALIKETLSSGSLGDWLMIVDNADDLSIKFGTTNGSPASVQLSDCIPYSNRGSVLFTTRSKDVAEELTPKCLLGLNDLSKAEARQLLARRVTKQALLNGETAVDELLETLTYLPLAIVQAAAFINNNHITVSEYRSLFRHPGSEAELFREHFEDPSRYQDMDNTIATTWHISFNQLRRQNPLAAKYLSFIACIDRFNIPLSLLPHEGSPVQQTRAVGSLIGYAFITERQKTGDEHSGDRFFDMHRLVHMASIGWLNEHGERVNWINSAVARLEELIPIGGHMEKKEFWSMYLSHAIYVSGLDEVGQLVKGSLLDRVANRQTGLGQYSAATATFRQTLSIRFECLGLEHPDSLTTMNALAIVHNNLGKFKEATELHRRTLGRRKKVLGPDHEDTLQSMNNLALGLRNEGKYIEAETLYKQTLERQKTLFGPKHTGTLFSMNNLAELLAIHGKYEEAERMYKDADKIQRELYGDMHPTVLLTQYNLARVYERVLGDADGWSESDFREVLKLQEEVLGPNHPDTLTTLHSLAALRARLGHFQEAEAMFRRILAEREITLGPKHIATVQAVYALAHTLRDQKCWKEALALFERAGDGYIACLGDKHPTFKACVVQIAKAHTAVYAEENPPTDEPFKLPPYEPLKPMTMEYEGHPEGNHEPWDQDLLLDSGVEIEPTSSGKTSRLARSLAKIGMKKLLH
jgi:tetratricopeptide (TPR) repeat protein